MKSKKKHKNNYLLSEIRFYYAQCTFASRMHFVASSRYKRNSEWFHWGSVAFTALTLITLVSTIIWKESDYLAIISGIALLTSAASIVLQVAKDQDHTAILMQHKMSGDQYKRLRDKYLHLLTEYMSGRLDALSASSNHEKYIELYDTIGLLSNQISQKDYNKTQVQLGFQKNNTEAFSWSDEQINILLPSALKWYSE